MNTERKYSKEILILGLLFSTLAYMIAFHEEKAKNQRLSVKIEALKHTQTFKKD